MKFDQLSKISSKNTRVKNLSLIVTIEAGLTSTRHFASQGTTERYEILTNVIGGK